MSLETIIKYLGGLFAYSVLGLLLFGVWRGTQRQAGLTTGVMGGWFHSPWFYLVTSVLFFGVSYMGWVPLPWSPSPVCHAWMIAIGSLLYFPGLALVLWGRLALGSNYFVSTGFGAQLFAGHQLVTSGPYAYVRHPMYMGLFLAGLGSFFLYFTWTALLFAVFAPFVMFRAFREEGALSAEFGEKWQEYCEHVPAFFPRLHAKR